MEGTHDEGQRVIEDFAKRPADILAAQVIVIRNGRARKPNGFNNEGRFDPLRALGKEQHASQIQIAFISGQIQVLHPTSQTFFRSWQINSVSLK
jgi:hypothetical protein